MMTVAANTINFVRKIDDSVRIYFVVLLRRYNLPYLV